MSDTVYMLNLSCWKMFRQHTYRIRIMFNDQLWTRREWRRNRWRFKP